MNTKKVIKAPLCKDTEHLIQNAPYTIFGSSCIQDSFQLTMKAGGLRAMLDKYKLDGEDTFRIEIFAGFKAHEFSFIKHNNKKEGKSNKMTK